MNLKQRFSVLTATALPLLALSAYLLTGPTKAQAFDDCPNGGTYQPAGNWGCVDGHSGGVNIGGSGIFVYCNYDQWGDNPGAGGEGSCDESQCVHCEYGPF